MLDFLWHSLNDYPTASAIIGLIGLVIGVLVVRRLRRDQYPVGLAVITTVVTTLVVIVLYPLAVLLLACAFGPDCL